MAQAGVPQTRERQEKEITSGGVDGSGDGDARRNRRSREGVSGKEPPIVPKVGGIDLILLVEPENAVVKSDLTIPFVKITHGENSAANLPAK
jgi:hypothetical protein